MITTEQIKELRDATGVSVMQCKKALEEAGGDMEKAVIILRKVSKAAAEKKFDRTLGAGVVATYVHGEGSIGTMVELLCETDFVSRNEEFKALARDIAMHVAAMNPQFLKSEDIKEEDKVKAKELFEAEAKETGKTGDMLEKIVSGKLESYFKEKVLLDQSYIKNPEVTIRNLVEQAVQKFGEKVELVRFVRFAVK
jgi:elongation factor Ts